MFWGFFYVRYWHGKENEVLRCHRATQFCRALVLATTKSKAAKVFSEFLVVS